MISAQVMHTTTVTHHGGVLRLTSVLTVPIHGALWSLVVAEQAVSRVPLVVHTVGTTDTLGTDSTWLMHYLRVQQSPMQISFPT